MPNFDDYFEAKPELTGPAPPEGDFYLVLRSGVLYKTTFLGARGFAGTSDDADVTTINTVSVWVPIANTLILKSTTPTLSFAANTFTYAGIDQAQPSVLRASMTCRKTGGNSMVYQVGIAINGTVIEPDAYHGVSVDATDFSFVATEYHYALQQGDTVQMQVRNISGNDNFVIQDAQLAIS